MLANNATSPNTKVDMSMGVGGSLEGIANLSVRTNASGQIRYRASASTTNTHVKIRTLGWIDDTATL